MVSGFAVSECGVGICSERTVGINRKLGSKRKKDSEAKEKGVPGGVNTDGQPKAVTDLQSSEVR
jgi:hypothetical protein